jgi:hypothetical protein
MSDPKSKKSKAPTRVSTPAEKKAGRANLLAFRATCDGRPALTHGIRSTIASGRIPAGIPGASEVAEQADAIVAQMVSDLGFDKAEEMPAAQRAILESQRLNLLVLGLANRFIRTQGVVTKKGKPTPILAVCVSFSNALRHNALALGLERKPRKVGPSSLAEYLNSRPTESATEGVPQ